MNATPPDLASNSANTLTQDDRAELRRLSAKHTHWNPRFVLSALEQLVQLGELEELKQFKEGALLQARVPGWPAALHEPATFFSSGEARFSYPPEHWAGLPLAAAAWLQHPNPVLHTFARDWIDTFKGDADIPELAAQQLMHELDPTRGRVVMSDLGSGMHRKVAGGSIDLVRAQRLVELAVPPGSTPARALAPVLDQLLDWDGPKATPESVANNAAVFAHIARVDALAHPEDPEHVLVLAGGRNPITGAMLKGKSACLLALADVYSVDGEPSAGFRAAACMAMREVLAAPGFDGSPSDIRSTPILRGWLDAATANAVLTSTVLEPKRKPGEMDEHMVRRTYGRALAEDWTFMPEAMELVRKLKEAGGDLDVMVTVREAESSTEEWTGTLLHEAVAHGTSELVHFLLVRMGCDPYLPWTRRDTRTGEASARDAFAIIQDDLPDDEPMWRERSQAVDEILRAWRAHQHANDAMVEVLTAAVAAAKSQ